jgi:hypothetical protein
VRRVLETLVAAIVALLLAVGLAACGGGDSSTSTAAEADQGGSGAKSNGASTQGDAKSGSKAKPDSGGEGKAGGSGDAEGQSGGGNAASFVPKHHNDSGGGSQQYRVKGGDNSVQEFGSEADTEEFDTAAVVLHNFLDARAEGNWAATCEYMSKAIIQSFEELVARAKEVEATSCGEILEKLTNPAAKQSMKAEAEKANAGSLRIEDERAFVIYTGIEDTIFAMPMANEAGVWKVASLAPTPLN